MLIIRYTVYVCVYNPFNYIVINPPLDACSGFVPLTNTIVHIPEIILELLCMKLVLHSP